MFNIRGEQECFKYFPFFLYLVSSHSVGDSEHLYRFVLAYLWYLCVGVCLCVCVCVCLSTYMLLCERMFQYFKVLTYLWFSVCVSTYMLLCEGMFNTMMQFEVMHSPNVTS